MKKYILSIFALMAAVSATAGVPYRIIVPDVDGYQTLIGDFHIHTSLNSDAGVWPSYRVDEAWWEGLDFISLTNHMDLRLQNTLANDKPYFDVDRDEAWRIAHDAGKKKDIIVIHGGELTRGMPPGHFNTHFVTSCTKVMEAVGEMDRKKRIDSEDMPAMLAGLKEARRQGAFIVWNHPHWEAQTESCAVWYDEHSQILEAGLMDGIEIVNGPSGVRGYSPEAHHWCIEKNLAIVSGTDCHNVIRMNLDVKRGDHRPVTLVFAKERSEEGIREALDSRLSCVFSENKVYGSEKTTGMLLDAVLDIKVTSIDKKSVTLKMKNLSSIPVEFKKANDADGYRIWPNFTLKPFEEMSMTVKKIDNHNGTFDIDLEVVNFFVDAYTPAHLKLNYKK